MLLLKSYSLILRLHSLWSAEQASEWIPIKPEWMAARLRRWIHAGVRGKMNKWRTFSGRRSLLCRYKWQQQKSWRLTFCHTKYTWQVVKCWYKLGALSHCSALQCIWWPWQFKLWWTGPEKKNPCLRKGINKAAALWLMHPSRSPCREWDTSIIHNFSSSGRELASDSVWVGRERKRAEKIMTNDFPRCPKKCESVF